MVTVKLPENVLFTQAMRNPDDVFGCCIIFKFCPQTGVLLYRIKRNKCVLVVDWHKIPLFSVVVFKIKYDVLIFWKDVCWT